MISEIIRIHWALETTKKLNKETAEDIERYRLCVRIPWNIGHIANT